jgi:alpha-galactosidase
MDPLLFWRHNDAPDRQGITEMKYAMGIYNYWDRLRSTWPDILMEECASGGHRTELGTIKRFDFHQKTDYWFDNESDQATIWSLSQYLPNNTISAHLSKDNSPNLDDYSFHSTMASSLCFAWIADAPNFDAARAKQLIDRYTEVRHLLVGAWYPLLPNNGYDHDSPSHQEAPLSPGAATSPETATQGCPGAGWVGSQYHRPDLDEGMLLVFRHITSPCRTVEVALRAVDEDAVYEVTSDLHNTKRRINGSDLSSGFQITLEDEKSSDLLVYKKISN